jgi:hypothetical protein
MRYHEEQRFGGTALKLLTVGLLLPIPIIAAILFLTIPGLRDNPWPLGIVFALVFLFDLVFWIVALRTRLVVDVEENGVVVAVRPFTRRTIPATQIERVEWLSEGLFRRYGGGIGKRWSDKRSRYTVMNDAGVVLTLTDGWTVVLGSKRPEELGTAVREVVLNHRPDVRRRLEEQEERQRQERWEQPLPRA